jgi:hypothetical protein
MHGLKILIYFELWIKIKIIDVYKTYESPDDDLSKIETCCDAECNNIHVKTYIFYYVFTC